MSPENRWLEDVFPTENRWLVTFEGTFVSFQGSIHLIVAWQPMLSPLASALDLLNASASVTASASFCCNVALRRWGQRSKKRRKVGIPDGLGWLGIMREKKMLLMIVTFMSIWMAIWRFQVYNTCLLVLFHLIPCLDLCFGWVLVGWWHPINFMSILSNSKQYHIHSWHYPESQGNLLSKTGWLIPVTKQPPSLEKANFPPST